MKKKNDIETEKLLAAFSHKPTPPGLKEKILDGALQRQNSNHVMNAFLWKGFVGCLMILIFVIAVDATITKAQNKRFSSMLDGHQESTGNVEEEWSMLKDIIWEPLGSNRSEAKMKFYDLLENSKNKTRQPEWRESLKEEFE